MLEEMNSNQPVKMSIFHNFQVISTYFNKLDLSVIESADFSPVSAFTTSNKGYFSICSEKQCIVISILDENDISELINRIHGTLLIPCSIEDEKYFRSPSIDDKTLIDIRNECSSMRKYLKPLLQEGNKDSFSFNSFLTIALDPILTYFVRRNYYQSKLFNDPNFFSYQAKEFRKFAESDFIKLRRLGCGAQGEVYLCFHKESGHLFALKTLFKTRQFLKEKKFYMTCKHSTLVKSYGFINDIGKSPSIVLEFMCNGSVSDLIKAGKLDENEKSKIVIRILYAIDYLHSKGLMHRDVKPGNSLVNNENEYFLSDFDTAREYEKRIKLTRDTGTYLYMSPEEINSNDYSFQTDLYSLGIYIYELSTGRNPFVNHSLQETFEKIKEGKIPKLSLDFGGICNLYKQLIDPDPSHRSTTFAILNDILEKFYYSNVNIDEIKELVTKLSNENKIGIEQRIDFRSIIDHANDGDPYCQTLLGIFNKDKNKDLALKWLNKASDQNHAPAQYNIGVIYKEEGNHIEAYKWFKIAADNDNPDALYELGSIVYSNKSKLHDDYFEIFMKAAKLGHSEAQVKVGELIEYGDGNMINDYNEAFNWLLKAAKQGNVHAQMRVSSLYFAGMGTEANPKKGFNWAMRAYNNGDKRSIPLIAESYLNGEGTAQDYKQAFKWFLMAANDGNIGSAYHVGILYYDGNGVEQDYEKAMNWLLIASEKKSDAEFKIGYMYETGKGVDRNMLMAKKWYKSSANNSNESAKYHLGIIYYEENDYSSAFDCLNELVSKDRAMYLSGLMCEEGKGVKQDFEKSRIFYNKAAELGSIDAMIKLGILSEETGKQADLSFNSQDKLVESAENGGQDSQFKLGMIYYKGKNSKRNLPLAIQWLTKAANQGNEEAEYQIGMMYYEGEGVDMNFSKAADYLWKSANKGKVEAQVMIGKMYINGDGLEKDVEKAVQWFEKAASKENPEAQCQLGIIYKEKDVETAKQLFEQAASQNNNEAMYQLSIIENSHALLLKAAENGLDLAKYLIGNSMEIENKIEEAISWYKQSNQVEAKYHLGQIFEGRQDWKKAIKYYEKSAAEEYLDSNSKVRYVTEQKSIRSMLDYSAYVEGNRQSFNEVARLYTEGADLQYLSASELFDVALALKHYMRDEEASNFLINEAISKGNNDAKYYWAHKLIKEERDVEIAIELLLELTDIEYPAAEFELAKILKDGKFIDQDEKYSMKLFKKAAKHGICEAALIVGKYYEDQAALMYEIGAHGNEEAGRCLKRLRPGAKVQNQLSSPKKIFNCFSCGMMGSLSICGFCAKSCHAGEEVIDIGNQTRAFKCKCKDSNKCKSNCD